MAWKEASRFAIQALLLPVRSVLEATSEEDFYAPGSIFRLELDTTQAIARGLPHETIGWFEGGPAFEVLDRCRASRRALAGRSCSPAALRMGTPPRAHCGQGGDH